MKLALVGGGYWGKNLIREFNNCGVLDTICEIDEEATEAYSRQYPAVTLTDDWDSIMRSTEITAVCISLPAEMHYRFAKEALESGKDVYVEKPITLNIEEAEELVRLAEERGLILMVGHLLHYHGAVIKMREIISEGAIGTIRNITSNRLNLGKFRSQENVLWSFAPHDISVILSLCGSKLPDKYHCSGVDHLKKGVHDTVNSVMSYGEDGIYININVSWLNPFKEQKMIVVGETGMIVLDDTLREDKLRLFKDTVTWDNSIRPSPLPNKTEGQVVPYDDTLSPLLRECQHFVDCCAKRKPPTTDGSEGVRVLKVLSRLQSELTGIKHEHGTYVHPSATVDEGADVGKGTKIWHYSHICKGAKIGENCNIGQNVFIAGGAVLGNNCKVQNNVSIYAGVEADDYVFLGPSCVLTNDFNPRGMHSKQGRYVKTKLETGVTLGANCTIVCGNTIGRHALIGAGCVITKDVEANSVMVGNPGKKIGIIDSEGNMDRQTAHAKDGHDASQAEVNGRSECADLIL